MAEEKEKDREKAQRGWERKKERKKKAQGGGTVKVVGSASACPR